MSVNLPFLYLGPYANLLNADGFFLDHNESDSVFLDDIIFSDLTSDDMEALRSHEYNW